MKNNYFAAAKKAAKANLSDTSAAHSAAMRCTLCSLVSMNSTKTEYASKQLEAMTVGFTKIVNGKSVTRWSVNRWEVGTFGKNDAMNLTETLVELGFDVE